MVTARRMSVLAGACVLTACGGKGAGPAEQSLAERLQGNWYYQSRIEVGEFLRSGHATLAVESTTIRYTWNVLWDCADWIPGEDGSQVPACSLETPRDRGGYFEGVFRDLGDSLELQDGVDTLAFLDLAGREDSAFTFMVNGTAFPMQRR